MTTKQRDAVRALVQLKYAGQRVADAARDALVEIDYDDELGDAPDKDDVKNASAFLDMVELRLTSAMALAAEARAEIAALGREAAA